jgi:hypothetical protein
MTLRLSASLSPLLQNAAALHGLEPILLEAQALHESAGRPWVIRYEKTWAWFVRDKDGSVRDPGPREGMNASSLAVLDSLEITAQKTSFGLLQVMGAVARELGYRGSLWAIREKPEIGLDLGANKFSQLLHRHGNTRDALAAYNAGSGNLAAGYGYADAIQEAAEAIREATS